MVMTFRAIVRFTVSIMAASVVDFPLPTVPHTSTRPRGRLAISSMTGGRFSSSNVGIVAGTCRKTIAIVPRCW